jgi:hypothetical protein
MFLEQNDPLKAVELVKGSGVPSSIKGELDNV